MAARSFYTGKHPSVKLEDMIIYTTTQTHSLGVKAALVLGLECRALDVTADDRFALRGATLRKALEADKARGKHPFVLGMYDVYTYEVKETSDRSCNTVATVGTTSSGAIDRLDEIAEVGRYRLSPEYSRPLLTVPIQSRTIHYGFTLMLHGRASCFPVQNTENICSWT